MSVYKIAIVGDGGVGKSSLLEAKLDKTFSPQRITIGVDFKLLPLEKLEKDGKQSTFLAMDLGGQERFHFIHDSYIKGIKGALILFDATRPTTFLHISNWYKLIMRENDKIPVLIIGNKIDLIDVEQQEALTKDLDTLVKLLPKNQNIYGHYFTSSKNFEGIDETFAICEEMILSAVIA